MFKLNIEALFHALAKTPSLFVTCLFLMNFLLAPMLRNVSHVPRGVSEQFFHVDLQLSGHFFEQLFFWGARATFNRTNDGD